MQQHKISNTEVPKRQLVKMMRAIEKVDDDQMVSLEFVLTALFPTVWNNVQKALQHCYDEGFRDGMTQAEAFQEMKK